MTNPRDLVQLRALYQQGLLTEDEYTEARRRLLGYKVKRGRAVPPSAVAPQRAPQGPPSRVPQQSPPPDRERRVIQGQRSLNAQSSERRGDARRGSRREQRAERNPNSDLPLLFALAALSLVAIAATVWFLMG